MIWKRFILTGLFVRDDNTIVLAIISKQGSSDAFNVYTVSPQCSETAGGAIAEPCHELSFYVKNIHQYFVSNTTFMFQSGRHILNASEPVNLTDVSNITFVGLHNDKDTVPIIHCTNGTRGFVFNATSGINIDSLIIEGCGGPAIEDSFITVINGTSVRLTHLTIRNTIGIALNLQQVHTLEMTNSSFSNNVLDITPNCSLNWESSYSILITARNIPIVKYTIINTVFTGTNNTAHQLGGGLYINVAHASSSFIILEGSTFRGIKTCSAAAFLINKHVSNASVVVGNSTFIGIHSQYLHNGYLLCSAGGALTINLVDAANLYASIIIIKHNDFLNNTGVTIGGAFIFTRITGYASILISNNKFIGNRAFHVDEHKDVMVGGLSMYIDGTNSTKRIEVKHCTFEENSSPYTAALVIKPKLQGMKHNANITIDNCTFSSNRAAHPTMVSYHGDVNPSIIRIAINKFLHGIWTDMVENTTVQMTIIRCQVVKNKNVDGYAALQISSTGNYKVISNSYAINADVIQCYFGNNSAVGIISKVGNLLFHMRLYNSTFSGHSNNAIQIFDQMTRIYSNHEPTFLIEINYLTVGFTEPSGTDNDSSLLDSQSALYTECSSRLAIITLSNIHMHNNKVSPILNINCGLQIGEYNVIENNSAKFGGAIQIRGIGYAFLDHGTLSSLTLQNNKASYGGALFSLSQEYISHNSMCTFLSLQMATFYNNSATIAGNNVYGGVLKDCKYAYHSGKKIYYKSTNHSLPFVQCGELASSENGINHGMFQAPNSVSSNPLGVLACSKSNSTTAETNVTLYPGERITLSVMTAGYCNSFSPGFLNITTQTKGLQIMEEDIKGQQVDVPCKKIHFKPLTESIVKGTILIDVAQTVFSTTAPLVVNVQFLPCPHGMFLGSTACQCNDTLAEYMDQCDISHFPNPFRKKALNRNKWIAYNKYQHCIVVAPICPRDYCSLSEDVYFNLDNTTDYQCSNNRTGTLCGQCQPGLSLMLGSNTCGDCSNKYLLLIIVFVIAGLVLGAVITFLNLTVSIGMLSGLLFYANIVKLNEVSLFPNGDIPVISQFISWLNLDFGIQVCFFNGLDGYWKTWLQFAFPLYVCLVTIGIIVCSKYSIKLSQHLPTNIIPVLATLILISFTKLLRTVTAVFMATRLHCGTHTHQVWSVDGSIDYWSIKHSLLMGFSALVLVFVSGYTFLLLFSRRLHRASNYKLCCCLNYIIPRINPFIDAYTGPLAPKYGYWAGVLVLIRIIVTILFTYTSGSMTYINNYIIMCIQVTIISVFSSSYYQSKINYLCEKFFHINLCTLCIVNSFCYQNSTGIRYVSIATALSVSTSMVVFISIAFWQIYRKRFAKLTRATAACYQWNSDDAHRPLLQHGTKDNQRYGPRSPQVTTGLRRRDSIIFDLN